jgi:hypothetical protein
VLTQKIPAYRMVIFGSFVAASSVFIMTIPPQRFQRLADGRVGHAIANSWLGGYSRFSPDDFRDLPAFANQLQYWLQLGQSLPEGIPFADHPGAAQPADRERLSATRAGALTRRPPWFPLRNSKTFPPS